MDCNILVSGTSLRIVNKRFLKNTYFSTIDEVLLRYYLYQNSGKKCRELDDVVQIKSQILFYRI